jgi:hypothetical protein
MTGDSPKTQFTRFPKTLLVTFVVSASMATAMALVGERYGWHSTPGIWIMILNLSGMAFAGLVAGFGEGFTYVAYALIPLVNWAAYFYVAKGMILLKRKLHRGKG